MAARAGEIHLAAAGVEIALAVLVGGERAGIDFEDLQILAARLLERSDAGLLEQVLRPDATLEATPFREWQAGPAMCIHMLDTYVLGAPGDWRMIATTANGQPAAVVYHRNAGGALRFKTAST